MTRYVIPLVLFIAMLVLLTAGLSNNPRIVPSPLIDRPLPPFSLPRLFTPDVNIGPADFNGGVTLLNVWASWCTSCRVEHPLFMELSESEEDIFIYGLNYKDKRENAMQWLQRHGNPFKASAYDEKGMTGIDLGVYGVPETYIVDAAGIVRLKHIGPVTKTVLENKIRPLLNNLRQETE